MRNFMPYRGDVPSFSFDGIHTACICGDNGNGKSALIDAVTWALWGKSRAKSDDDLIHQGENDMEVEFEFYSGRQLYRIIRKHTKPRSSRYSGQSSLDLFLSTGEEFKTISGDVKTQTQQNIISLLNMDYDTFINSAFIKQGHADEFTKQTPSKRKEVLSSILGLSVYDKLEEKARELFRHQHLEIMQLENTISEIEQELIQKTEVGASLERAQADLASLDSEAKGLLDKLNRLRRQMETLENKKLLTSQFDRHINETRRDLEGWRLRIKQRQSRVKQYRELLSQRDSIEDGYSSFFQAKIINDDLNKKLQWHSSINQKKSQFEEAVQNAQSKLLTEHAVSLNKIVQLETVAQKLPQLKDRKAELEHEQQKLDVSKDRLDMKKKEYDKLKSTVYEIECNLQRLQQEINDTQEKLQLLKPGDNARCPLCETELGEGELSVISVKYSADIGRKEEILVSQAKELSTGKARISDIAKGLRDSEEKYNREIALLQGKCGALKQAISEAEEATGKLDKAKSKLIEIENRLTAKDFARQEQAALDKLEIELTGLEYDPEKHRQAGNTVADFVKYEQQKHRLDEADKMLELEQDELSGAEETLKTLSLRMDNYAVEKSDLIAELKDLPRLEIDLNLAESGYLLTSEKQSQAQELIGALRGKLEHLIKQEQKQQTKKSQLDKISKEARVYLDLTQAFGKKGIQAMLIEIALPDIENEANKLLGRMTDNRMHIKIETQRQSKKGETIETLDIIISDELGSRNYEMFSGGEAFRIDFAIRIALSRLLAMRVGAPLPTLIIDEGFGTQDSTGIEKLKEAISSIQPDFEKILVITHIDEFKDAFQTRINVIKTAEGSTLEIS
ncbi:AAA family ATPase [Chloroflexota bacterium]